MEVTGISVAEAQRIENASIVDGRVDASGNLVLINGAGAEFNAGKVVVPLAGWPVGSIFTHVTSTDPSVLLGGGTWERFGMGRVLVSQNAGDPEFDTALETGGAKAVALTSPGQNAPHVHGVNDPGHVHSQGGVFMGIGGAAGEAQFIGGSNTGSSGTGISIQSSGGGETHNNLQPYIVVHMWQRTA